MAKIFRMLAPFDVVTGNVSGAQELKYPLNGGRAYDAPAGSKQYAQNYKPRFIMHERKSDGKLYFQLRQRTCVHKTAKSTLAMAALGACGAIIGAIYADKSSELYARLETVWALQQASPANKFKSMRQWLSDTIIPGLKAKYDVFNIAGYAVTLNNPFVSGGTGMYNVTISNEVLIKFWGVLANNPITFTIANQKGIAHSSDKFEDVIEGGYNVLGMTIEAVQDDEDTVNTVKLGDKFVGMTEETTSGDLLSVLADTPINYREVYYLMESYVSPK